MVDAEVRHGLADQIRALRERAGWSQADLARRLRTSQPNVARMEARRNTYLALPSLLAVAKAFDVGLLVRFVPFSEIVRRSFDTSDFEQAPLSFDEEVAFTARHVVAPASMKATFSEPVETSASERTTVQSEHRSGEFVEVA